MAGALGGDHQNVHIGRGSDLAVVDVEAVGEHDGLAGGQVGGDILLIHIGLLLVVDQDHDDICCLSSLGSGHDGEAVLLSHGPALAALIQADDDIAAGITQVHGVGMALGAITDDGDLLTVEVVDVAILLIIHFCHNYIPP